jgi:hypothetical protein
MWYTANIDKRSVRINYRKPALRIIQKNSNVILEDQHTNKLNVILLRWMLFQTTITYYWEEQLIEQMHIIVLTICIQKTQLKLLLTPSGVHTVIQNE